MKVTVTGKGGVGKTTVAGSLARMLAERGEPVYALDADPDANLASALGFPAETLAEIVPLADLKDLIRERTGAQPGYGAIFKLNPKVDDIPETYSREHKGVKLLIMGGVPQGGGGCFCPENTVTQRLLEEFLIHRDTHLILDMEAGLEHLSRGTAGSIESMLIVVEPGQRSIATARSIRKLCSDLGITSVKVVGNKIRSERDEKFLAKSFGRDEYVGSIPYDDVIADADREGIAPIDAGSARFDDSMRAIMDTLGKE